MKEKVEYLLSMGFKPMYKNSKSIFSLGKFVYTISSDVSLEDMKKEIENYTKGMDIFEKESGEPEKTEPASISDAAGEVEELPFVAEDDDPVLANS